MDITHPRSHAEQAIPEAVASALVTADETAVLRATWSRVAQREEAAATFYDKLFELDPSLRAHFPSDLRAQRRKLMATLDHVVAHLDRFELLVEEVRELGRRHRSYGARPADYSTVGDALLFTLEQGLGEAWTHEAERAWERTYTALSQTMVRAAEES